MAARRTTYIEQMVEAVGETKLTVEQMNTGWPAKAVVASGSSVYPFYLHGSVVGTHSRAWYEHRFQGPDNTGNAKNVRPVLGEKDRPPLLVGIYKSHKEKVIVVADGRSRQGQVARVTVLFHRDIISLAITQGFASYINDDGDYVYAVLPEIFPLVAEYIYRDEIINIRDLGVQAASNVDKSTKTKPSKAERRKMMVERLERNARFSHDVREAYAHRCAMCGLGMEIVVGAHIWPVAAKGSPDVVSNGLALCENHHAAFDRHVIGVVPETLAIKIHASVIAKRSVDKAIAHFLKGTLPTLRKPASGAEPDPQMFVERHKFVSPRADWIRKS